MTRRKGFFRYRRPSLNTLLGITKAKKRFNNEAKFIEERIPDLTILEALAITTRWHLWAIVTPDGNVRIEMHCKSNKKGECRHHSYSLTSNNHLASNADSIEIALDFFDDEAQRKLLREASLSQRWIFYGFQK